MSVFLVDNLLETQAIEIELIPIFSYGDLAQKETCSTPINLRAPAHSSIKIKLKEKEDEPFLQQALKYMTSLPEELLEFPGSPPPIEN